MVEAVPGGKGVEIFPMSDTFELVSINCMLGTIRCGVYGHYMAYEGICMHVILCMLESTQRLMMVVFISKHYLTLLITSFPCQYRQSRLVGLEPAMPTRRLMRRLTIQHDGTCMKRQHRKPDNQTEWCLSILLFAI